MTASFIGVELDARTVQNYLIEHIEREFKSEDIKVHGIQDVVFVGDLTNIEVPSTGEAGSNTRETQSNDGKSNHVALASSLSVGVVVLFFLVFAALRRRRKREINEPSLLELEPQQLDTKESNIFSNSDEAEETIVAIPSDYVAPSGSGEKAAAHLFADTQVDVENPPYLLTSSTTTIPQTQDTEKLMQPPVPLTSTLSTPNTNGTETLTLQCSPNVVRARSLSPHGSKSSSMDAAAILSDISSLQKDTITTCTVEGVTNINTMSEVPSLSIPSGTDVLPPKPPGIVSSKPPTGSSKSIKTTRKKKKKKKASLIRVNSRESINEMETITEENGEEKDSDCSEYSWCSTDDEDSKPGSRDPSPARSNPRSRDPSPSTRSRGSIGSGSNVISNSSSSSLDSSQILSTIDVPSNSFEEKDPDEGKPHSLPTWV
jgi:hypothetical protein